MYNILLYIYVYMYVCLYMYVFIAAVIIIFVCSCSYPKVTHFEAQFSPHPLRILLFFFFIKWPPLWLQKGTHKK